MLKKWKGLLIIGVILATTIPTTVYYINKTINDEMNNSHFQLIDAQFKSFSNTSIKMVLYFSMNLSRPLPISISVEMQNVKIEYNNTIIGNITFLNESLSISNEIMNTEIEILFNSSETGDFLIDEFTKQQNLTFKMMGTLAFVNLPFIQPKIIEENFTLNGLSGNMPELTSYYVKDTTPNTVTLGVDAIFNNTSDLELNLNDFLIDIYYLNNFIANVTSIQVNSTILIRKGMNYFSFDGTIGGDKSIVASFIEDLFMGGNYTIDLKLSSNIYLSSDFNGSSIPFNYSIPINFTVPEIGLNFSLVGIGIQLSPLAYVLNACVIVENPLNISANFTGIDALITFDDPDGTPGFFGYSPDYNITLAQLTENWTAEPFMLQINQTNTKYLTYADNDIEKVNRLIDEYTNNKLELDIPYCRLNLQIGEYELTLTISYWDLFIPYEEKE